MECLYCSKDAGVKTNGSPKQFCSTKHFKAWTVETKQSAFKVPFFRNLPVEKARMNLVKKARDGCPYAQSILRMQGIRGLWNPITKEMVRF